MYWSEKLFADFLDDRGIEWRYEPHCFIIEEKANGDPKRGLRPDFYLPMFDLYVEITVATQKNITKKRRKVRMLREQRPDIQVQLLERRDVQRLSDGTFELTDLNI